MATTPGRSASKKRKLVDFSELPIAIIVGQEKKMFVLHPNILSNNSKFFRSSFSGRWASANPISLPEIEAPTFQIYAGYVYTGEIELPFPDLEEEPLNSVDEKVALHFEALTKLYVLANMLDDKALRNISMDRLQNLVNERTRNPGTECIKLAFEATHDTSTLCRYLLDLYLWATEPKWIETSWSELPSTFVGGLIVGWAKSSFDRNVAHKSPASVPKCTYHEHDDEIPMADECAQGFVEPVIEQKTPKKKARNIGARWVNTTY